MIDVIKKFDKTVVVISNSDQLPLSEGPGYAASLSLASTNVIVAPTAIFEDDFRAICQPV